MATGMRILAGMTMAEAYDVVCVGESMALAAPDPPGPLRAARTLRLDVAGAESNVATYLALLGARVAWISRVGADPLGAMLLDRLAESGVDTRLVEVDPTAPTGVFFKDPGPDGTRVHYYRRGSAAACMGREVWTKTHAQLAHLSGVTPALSDSCADLVAYGLESKPATMSFDVNFRPALWSPEEAAPVLADLADRADLVFVGLDEAETLWNTRTPEDVRAKLPRPATLVVKDGAIGATSFTTDGTCFVPAPAVTVVEPVGAGDAFAAGYLYGVLRGLAEPARLRLGHLVAGSALRAVGDIGVLPPADELLLKAEVAG
jgi:2-dehydro-3-deoxygluconokinase